MARILSVSYDPYLLLSRELILEQLGHEVVSAEGFAAAYHECGLCQAGTAHFDLAVLGHSVPHEDKREIIRHCTQLCACPFLALLRPNESAVEGAAVSVESSDPQAVVGAVREILRSKGMSPRGATAPNR